jgi:hypothetical protein
LRQLNFDTTHKANNVLAVNEDGKQASIQKLKISPLINDFDQMHLLSTVKKFKDDSVLKVNVKRLLDEFYDD